jgi:hypothetical protein
MTSERQRQANRANAQASTGPKTASGKARSAKNAFRHGLSVPVCWDPALAPKVEVWAQHIAGASADAIALAAACRIAEAQLDLQRVRACRLRLIERALANPGYLGGVELGYLTGITPWSDAISQAPRLIGPDKTATVLCDLAHELPGLDRYERRARWRRKRAIREFDQVRKDVEPEPRAASKVEAPRPSGVN